MNVAGQSAVERLLRHRGCTDIGKPMSMQLPLLCAEASTKPGASSTASKMRYIRFPCGAAAPDSKTSSGFAVLLLAAF